MQTQSGTVLTWKNTETKTVKSGNLVKIGVFVGIAATDIEPGEIGAVSISGVHLLPKTPGTAWEAGERLAFDEASGTFAPGAGGGIGCVAAVDAPADEESGLVLLNVGAGADGGGGGPVDWTEIENKPADLVRDAAYQHTDNNYTTTEKDKLAGLENYDDTALSARVSANETAIADRYTKAQTDQKIAEGIATVDSEHFHPVTVLPDVADAKENHEYILIEYEQDGVTIKSKKFYLFYDGAYHEDRAAGVSLDGYATEGYVNNAVSTKQDTLVSGTNIKTVNGNSLVGEGNLVISEVPKGGKSRYALIKKSDQDGDLEWDYHPSWYAPEITVNIDGVSLYQSDDSGSSYSAFFTIYQDGSGVRFYGDGMDYEAILASKTYVNSQITEALADKQDTLESGVNIKKIGNADLLGSGAIEVATINNKSLLDGGNVSTAKITYDAEYQTTQISDAESNASIGINKVDSNTLNINEYAPDSRGQSQEVFNMNLPTKGYVDGALANKQDTLVSGTNIKTVNGNSLLGEGNLVIAGGDGATLTITTEAGVTEATISQGIQNLSFLNMQDSMYVGGLTENGFDVPKKSYMSAELAKKPDYVILDIANFNMSMNEFEQLFYSDKLIYIKDGYLNHLVTDKYTWDLMPETMYELSYIEGDNKITYQFETSDDIYYRGRTIKPVGYNLAVGEERLVGTYREAGLNYNVYSKIIKIDALPSVAGTTTYPHGIANIKQILQVYGFCSNGFVMNAPRQNLQDNIAVYQVSKSATNQNISIEVGKDRSSLSAYVCLVYAKNN